MAGQDLQDDLVALEKRHVSEVYDQIATHFTDIKHKAWPKVRQFLKELEPGSLVADVGCGNGRYLHINRQIYKLGCDLCEGLVNIANQRGHEVMVCDNLHLPYRDGVFDAAISIAVIHHFATTERRIQALAELARIIRPGGKIMIYVWAFEQKHRRFDGQDVLVPWNKPTKHHRRRATSKSSGGTASDFSSASSISEDDVTGESVQQADINIESETPVRKSSRPEQLQRNKVENTLPCNGASFVNSNTGTAAKCEESCISCKLKQSHLTERQSCSSGPSGVESSQNDNMKTQRSQSPPVRPSSLHLIHRHTADLHRSQNGRKHIRTLFDGQRKNIFPKQHIASSHNLSHPSFTKDGHVSHNTSANQRIRSKNIFNDRPNKFNAQACVKQSDSKYEHCESMNCRKTLSETNPDENGRLLSHVKPNSINKQFFRKEEATTVLTVSEIEQKHLNLPILREEPSVFSRLRTLITGKSTSDNGYCSDHVRNSHNKIPVSSWHEYYTKCVKVAEEDLKSFQSFCSLADADKEQDVLSREFVVREFPASSRVNINSDHVNPPASDECVSSCGLSANELGEAGHTCTTALGSCGSLANQNNISLDGNGNPCSGLDCEKTCRNEGEIDTVISFVDRKTKVVKYRSETERISALSRRTDQTLFTHQGNGSSQPSDIYMDSVVDDVFEDFATNMSACLTNLSRNQEQWESLGKSPSLSQNSACQRYYHVFKEGELEALIIAHVPSLTIVSSYFDHSNWCLIVQKRSSP